MDSADIVAALQAKDPAGLEAAYGTYADRLVSYCAGMLHDHDAAADAVHDTFIVAYERADQLRDPDRLRPWLYAIARNECLRVIRERKRSTELDEAATVSDESVDVAAGLRDDDLRTLVWAAADGLNPREREVLDLAVRHDLEMGEVASTLGVTAKHAHALLSKARQQLERAVAVVLVARTGRRDCPELDAMLGEWDGSLTVLLRKRAARHIDSCPTCSARRRKDVNAQALFAATPLLAAPLALRDDILFTASAAADTRAVIAERAGRFDRQGFPYPADRRGTLLGLNPSAAVAALVTAAVVVGGVLFAEARRDSTVILPTPVVPATSPAATTEPPTPTTNPAPEPTETSPATAPPPVLTDDPGEPRRTDEPVRPDPEPTTAPPRMRTSDATPDPTPTGTLQPTETPGFTLVPVPPQPTIILPPSDPDPTDDPPRPVP